MKKKTHTKIYHRKVMCVVWVCVCLLGITPHHYHETKRTKCKNWKNEETRTLCAPVRITLKYKIGKSKYFHWQFAYNTLRGGYVLSECVLTTLYSNYARFLFCHAQSKPNRNTSNGRTQQQQQQYQQFE